MSFIWLYKRNDERQAMTSEICRLCIAMKAISFIEKLPFRPYLLCSKPVKLGHYCTVYYYHLIFCAFSWPNMVKWCNSGIIITIKVQVLYLSANCILSTIIKGSKIWVVKSYSKLTLKKVIQSTDISYQ